MSRKKDNLDKYFITTDTHELPGHLKKELNKVKKLEWITVGYLASVVLVMYFALSSSQAMKTAWLEDMLSLVPAIVFLIANAIYDRRPPDHDYLYGLHKVFTVAFLLGSFALLSMGLYTFYDSLMALIKHEHPTIKHIKIFGEMIWFGWIMIVALLYSAVPAMILGRMKLPYAKKLHNKILYTDAETQKADWMTAGAAIVGIIGIGFGLWWADSVAAIFISTSIIKDGFTRIKGSIGDIMEKTPTKVDKDDKLPLLFEIHEFFKNQSWIKDVRIRMRENGQVLFGEVFIIPQGEYGTTELILKIENAKKEAKKLDWKVHELVIQPVNRFDEN